jgi:uncharacterized membrane protein YhiD involved in acid resistance
LEYWRYPKRHILLGREAIIGIASLDEPVLGRAGVGFLAPAPALHARGHVRRLTTAASIWLVADIGIAMGTSAYLLAVTVTILSMVSSLILLALVIHELEQRSEA